jgi:hypothetical protein
VISIIDEVAELNAQTHAVKMSLSGTLKITILLSFFTTFNASD